MLIKFSPGELIAEKKIDAVELTISSKSGKGSAKDWSKSGASLEKTVDPSGRRRPA